ncbi:MAG: LamG-like jellyroll fold domain-containing protein [Planctomycetota bacterium]|nr:LamG-like jellyroll fold domain-containing protein [Planctomycetota bacterium]
MNRLVGWLAVVSLVVVWVRASNSAEPIVNLQFKDMGALPAGAQFARPSRATYVGGDGRIHEVGPNVPRFALRRDENGVEMRGYLAEDAAENRLLWSSFEAALPRIRSSWSAQGGVSATYQKGISVHGNSSLQLAGEGEWLHRPVALGSFAAPDFRGHYLTAFVRTLDGKSPADDVVQVYASRRRGGPNEIPAARRFRDPLRVGAWWRIGGYISPENEGQDWWCGLRVTGPVLVDAIQLERRPRNGCEAPTSYIPTAGQPARRGSDVLSLDPQTLRWPQKEGTLLLWMRTGSPVHNGSCPVIRQEYQRGDTSQSLALMHHGSSLSAVLPAGGDSTSRVVPPNHWTQIVLSWRQGRGWLYVDGAQNGRAGREGFPVGADFGVPQTRLFVGVQLHDYQQLAGYVSRVALYSEAWDGDEVWEHYVREVDAAGGDTLTLVRPATTPPPAARPAIPREHWVRFKAELPLDAATSAVVYASDGRLVRTLWEARRASAGANEIVWDTGDDQGRRVPAGEYELRILQNPGIGTRYVATPGNGRVPQRAADEAIGSVHALHPQGVAVDTNGDVYVLGHGHGVGAQKYTQAGRLLWTHAPLDTGDVPTAICVSDGTLFVAGKHLYRIRASTGQTIRDAEGGWRVFLGDNPEPDATDRVRPELAGVREAVIERQLWGRTATRGVIADRERVYVSCWGQNQIRIFDRQTLAARGTLSLPRPGGLAFDPEGRLWAISGGDLVRREEGRWKVVVPRAGRRPYGLTVSGEGHLWITDLGDPCRLLEFTLEGKRLRSYGSPGTLQGVIHRDRLYAPTGVACAADGSLYVAEYLLHRIQKIDRELRPDWALYGGSYFENTSFLSDQPSLVYGLDGSHSGTVYEYRVDLEGGNWVPQRWWWLGHEHPTREINGYMVHGQQTHTIAGHRFLFSCHKTVRIYRVASEGLIPVARIGGRFSYYDDEGKLQRPQGAFPIWIDKNGDGLAQQREVEAAPRGRYQPEPHIGFSHDMEVSRNGTVYWGNFSLPLLRVDPRGVPHYSWERATVAGPDFEALGNVLLEGVGADREGNRYFDIFYKDDALKQPGIGHWSRRVIRCSVSRYDSSGRQIWNVGHKALGRPEPGGMHQPTCTRVEGEWVFVGDEAGMVHVWSTDGLYVGSVLRNIYVDDRRQRARKRGFLLADEVTIGEFWSLDVIQQPNTGRYFLAGQSHEFGEHLRVYEVTGLQRVRRGRARVQVGPPQKPPAQDKPGGVSPK